MEHPHHVQVHEVKSCQGCGKDLSAERIIKTIKRQVFDITLPQLEVMEHQVQVKECGCCKMQNAASFPAHVTAPVQHGERVKSVAVYFQHQQLIPEDRLQQVFEDIFQVHPYTEKKKRGRQARRTGHNLALRFKNYREDILRFLTNPLAPFTNNQGEQDLRMMKCKQKISGGFRSIKGAQIFARVRGFISTSRKQAWNILHSIQLALKGQFISMA